MSEFAGKKAQRNVKQSKTFISENVDRVQSTDERSQILRDAVTSPVAGRYPDLPSSLSILKDVTKGRGLWSNVAIRKGSTILKTRPFIYVLSIATLSVYCSYCAQPAIQESSLKRCTKCKQVWYCSSACQNADWQLHKHECSAIIRWIAASPEASPPPEIVRALGRILFARKVLTDDNPWLKEIQALQSHSSSLSPSATESFTQLAHALVRYLGVTSPTELEPYRLHSARDLVDLISRFTINAFTLTSPILSSLGVCLSPVASLLNHSCQPNAVVVFPNSDSSNPSHLPPMLHVIALKDISPSEEILVSYVDITFATPRRQEILKETYSFTCNCSLCEKTALQPDQREVVLCPKGCGGRCIAPFPPKQLPIWNCSSCSATYSSDAIDNLEDKRRVGQEALDKAFRVQYSDPDQALKTTTNIIPLLSCDLPPSAHPYLNILRLHQALLIAKLSDSDPNEVIDEAIRTAGLVVTGLTAILEEGHPILGIALAELGKLLAVDEPPESSNTVRFDFPPRGPQRLGLALETSKRALESLKIGFGKENEGGMTGIQVRDDIVKLEREAQAWQHGIQNLWEDTVLQMKYEKK